MEGCGSAVYKLTPELDAQLRKVIVTVQAVTGGVEDMQLSELGESSFNDFRVAGHAFGDGPAGSLTPIFGDGFENIFALLIGANGLHGIEKRFVDWHGNNPRL
jgi:hypothetical protein